MAISLTASGSQLLMTKYRKAIVEAVRTDEGQFNKIPRIEGNTDVYRWMMQVSDVTSIGNAVEGQAFPTPVAPIAVQPFVGYKVFNASIQITDVVLALAKGDATSFMAAGEYLIKSATRASLRYREGTHYLDGTNIVGVLAGTVTVGTTTMGVNGYDNVVTTRSSDRTSVNAMFWPNATYDIIDSTTLLSKGSVTVVNQNAPTSTDTLGNFTIAAPGFPAGCVTGDLIAWTGSYGLGYEGLSSLIDNDVSGTYQGVNFTSSPQAKVWISTVLGNGGSLRSLTPSIFFQAQQGAADKMLGAAKGGSPASLEYLANTAMAQQFYNMYNVGGIQANVTSFTANTQNPSNNRIDPSSPKVGQPSLTFTSPFGDVKLNLRYHCPQQSIFGVDYSQLGFIVSKELGWRPGVENMFTPSQTASVRTAQLYEVGQVAVFERRHMIKINDLTYTTTNSGA
jgi:hypothetical protein